MSASYFAQGDPAWSAVQIVPGAPKTNIGRIGCAVVAIAQAGRMLSQSHHDPRTLTEWGQTHGGFHGSLAKWDPLCRAVGLRAHLGTYLRGRVSGREGQHAIAKLRGAMHAALWGSVDDDAGHPVPGFAILDVDHDGPLGNAAGDHFILAIGAPREDARTYVCADPATGRTCEIDELTLTGRSPYGPSRPYVVRGVLRVSPLNAWRFAR